MHFCCLLIIPMPKQMKDVTARPCFAMIPPNRFAVMSMALGFLDGFIAQLE